MSNKTYMNNNNDLFSLKISDSIFVFQIKKNFRNKEWSQYFGSIQELLADNIHDNIVPQEIVFNFDQCEWVDPAPMLSLLITIKEYKARNASTKVTISIPSYTKQKNFNKDKVIKFLATEYFLNEMIQIADSVLYEKELLTIEKIDELKNINVQLNYSNSTIVPCSILDLNSFENFSKDIDEWIKDRIEDSEIRLRGREADYVIRDVLYKVKILLDETLQNILNHAHPDGKYLYAAVYLRFRHGLKNKVVSVEDRDRLKDALNKEASHCPRLDSSFVEENNSFIEIFVLDNGIGVPASFSVGKSERIDFRNSINEIMMYGHRTSKSKKRNLTDKGGLNLIYQLLHKENDYICGLSDGQWLGDSIPFPKTNTYVYFDPIDTNSKVVNGLCWIFRLSVNSTFSLNDTEWFGWDGTNISNNPIIEAYKDNPVESSMFYETSILDLRFSNSFRIENYLNSERDRLKIKKKSINKIVLVPEGTTKGGVWELIDNSLSEFSSLKNNEERVLILADIPEKEALIYTAALNKVLIYNEKADWKDKITRIVLITIGLRVCILNKVSEFGVVKSGVNYKRPNITFKINELESKSFVESTRFSYDSELKIHESIRDYISIVRLYETFLFWYNLSREPKKEKYFINKQIPWGENGKYIDGYLNFSALSSSRNYSFLLTRSLSRCYGFFQTNVCLFKSIDTLVTYYVENLNSLYEYDVFQNAKKVYVGSVYGSGWNERISLVTNTDENKDLIVNFFVHRSAQLKSNRVSLFFWVGQNWLDKYFPRTTKNYERIGKTYAIAEYGWKYFPIPRYDENEESFYKQDPRETYKDWQSLNNKIVSFGNYYYQGYSDLFKIDLKTAIESSFRYKTKLAEFLVCEFAFALNITKENEISPTYSNYWKIILEAKSRISNMLAFYEKEFSFVVYPNHLNTAIVVENIKEIFGDGITDDKVFPIDFIHPNNDLNAVLISPLIIESLKSLIESLKERKKKFNQEFELNILFFDCTLVSGRTRKQIKHLFQGLARLYNVKLSGFKSLVILDRSRLPYTLPSDEEIRGFWRLDMPRLSFGEQNPISYSLSEIQIISKILTTPAQNRINEWSEIWGPTSSGIINKKHGIEPTRLGVKDRMTKKFGINSYPPFDQIGGDSNLIDIVNSHGLSLYAIEAHTMTGRDDIAMNIIREKNLPASAKIELLCSQLLLFPRDFSNELKFEMLKSIYTSAKSIQEYNNHTALAALLLINQDSLLVKKTLKYISDIDINREHSINIDLQITLAYLQNKHNTESEFRFTKYDFVSIKHNHDNLWFIYKRFHFEIYESKGKLHATAISDIPSSNPKSVLEKLSDALIAFSKVGNIFENDIKDKVGDKDFFQVKQKMDNCYKEAEYLLNSYSSTRYSEFVSKVENDVLPFLKGIHSKLFALVKTKSDPPIAKKFNLKIESLIDSIVSQKELWVEEARNKGITDVEPRTIKITKKYSEYPEKYSSHENIWVVFDKLVENAIKNLLINSLYSHQKIGDFWEPQNSDLAHMWVKIEYTSTLVTIQFINATTDTKEGMNLKMKQNYRQEHYHCTNPNRLGCEFNWDILQKEQNLFVATLSLHIV